MYLAEDALKAMYGLRNGSVDGVVMVDVQILQKLHLERVEVHIQRQQVE